MPRLLLATAVALALLLAPLARPYHARAQEDLDEVVRVEMEAAMAELLRLTLDAMHTDWGYWLGEEWGMPIPDWNAVIIERGETFRSACDDAAVMHTSTPNARYCYIDKLPGATNAGAIILPVGTMLRVWEGDVLGRYLEGDGHPGDYATAAIAAHEFGHFVTFEVWEWLAARGRAVDLPPAPDLELIADCMAGEFLDSVDDAGFQDITTVDLRNVVLALTLLGDADPGAKGAHGTPTERGLAFLQGYTGRAAPSLDAPAQPIWATSATELDAGKRLCFDLYWPAAPGAAQAPPPAA